MGHDAAPPAATSTRKVGGAKWFALKDSDGNYVSWCWGTCQLCTYPLDESHQWGSYESAAQLCFVDGTLEVDIGATVGADPPYDQQFVTEKLFANGTVKSVGIAF